MKKLSLYVILVLLSFLFNSIFLISVNSAEYCNINGHTEKKIWSYVICYNERYGEKTQFYLAREIFIKEHILEITPQIKIDLYGTGKENLNDLFIERFTGPPGSVYNISPNNDQAAMDLMFVGCLLHACSEKSFMISNPATRKTLLGIIHGSMNGKRNDNNENSLINGGGHYLTLFSNDYKNFEDIKPRYIKSILEYLSYKSEYNFFIAYDPIIYFVGEDNKLVEIR
jgi:hypothetical protein